MSDETRSGGGGFSVRRIVVAVDGSAHALAALETAAALAQRMEAEIEALFVEDIDLLNLAALPFGTEFSLTTGRSRPYDDKVLADQLRSEAARARRALETLARQSHVRSTFRVARGRVAAEVMAAAAAADLLILGAAGRAIGFRFRPGRVALAVSEKAPRSVLLLRAGARLAGKPLVPYDGSAGADKALDAAAVLARLTGGTVHVVITEPDPAKAAVLRDAASRRLAAAAVAPVFIEELEATLETMCRLIARTAADVLVLSADDPKLTGEGRGRLLEAVLCPILLVR